MREEEDIYKVMRWRKGDWKRRKRKVGSEG